MTGSTRVYISVDTAPLLSYKSIYTSNLSGDAIVNDVLLVTIYYEIGPIVHRAWIEWRVVTWGVDSFLFALGMAIWNETESDRVGALF